MSEKDLSKTTEETGGQLAPVLPLRDIVVFPHMIVPLFVGREKSVRALEEVMSEEKQILLLTQKNAADDDPSPACCPRRCGPPACWKRKSASPP